MTLTAVALAEERPGRGAAAEPLVLVTIDGTWWRRVDDEATLRTTVLDATGLPVERLLVSLSHTHAGPVLCSGDADLPGGDRGVTYLHDLARAAADAAVEAIASLRPATLEWTTGRCGLASNREALLDGCAGGGGDDRGSRCGEHAAPAARRFQPRRRHPRSPGADPADDTVVVGRLTARPRAPRTPARRRRARGRARHPRDDRQLRVPPDDARVAEPARLARLRRRDARPRRARDGRPRRVPPGASGELAPREQYTGDTAVADRHGTSLGHAVLAALAELRRRARSWS